ncbi:MAG: DedA family protein [Fimbriiglobus sp.]
MFDWIEIGKYLGIAGTIIATGFGLPIPEEIPIVTAGAMVGHDAQPPTEAVPLAGLAGGAAHPAYLANHAVGLTKWYFMLPACILGVVIGDSVLYFSGRLFGARLLRSGFVTRRILPPEKREKIEENFRQRGVMILLAARFTPGIRTPVFLMSGVLKLPFSRFVLADGLYAIPGVNILFWLAYLFTDQFVEAVHAVEDKVSRYRPMIIMAVLAAALGVLLYRFLTTRTLATGDPADIPTYAKPVTAVASRVESAVEMAVEKTVETTMVVIDKVTHPHGHGPEGETRRGGEKERGRKGDQAEAQEDGVDAVGVDPVGRGVSQHPNAHGRAGPT